MHVGDRKRPPLSPQEGWLSDGRHALPVRIQGDDLLRRVDHHRCWWRGQRTAEIL